jgi:hypothetical protein
MDIARARLGIRVEAMLSVFDRSGKKRGQTYPHLKVKRVNDRAAVTYIPKPYEGRLAVIRPRGHFVGFGSQTLGWEGFARGGLTVHEIPAFPKGMLVDPFSRRLAEAVTACLSRS